MLSFIDVKFIFDSTQVRKYSPNSRCRPCSWLLAVLAMFLAIISPSSYSWDEWNVRHFCFNNQNNSTSSPGLLGWRYTHLQGSCTFDVIGWLIAKFFQIWSSVAGYGELCVCFELIRIREIFWMNNNLKWAIRNLSDLDKHQQCLSGGVSERAETLFKILRRTPWLCCRCYYGKQTSSSRCTFYTNGPVSTCTGQNW